jgi:hypothetical protein
MALGATRGRIPGWILSFAMSRASVGLVLGAAARQIRSMLYGVTPGDPWTFLRRGDSPRRGPPPLLRISRPGVPAALDPAITLRQE